MTESTDIAKIRETTTVAIQALRDAKPRFILGQPMPSEELRKSIDRAIGQLEQVLDDCAWYGMGGDQYVIRMHVVRYGWRTICDPDA